jgi:hypothetical protein
MAVNKQSGNFRQDVGISLVVAEGILGCVKLGAGVGEGCEDGKFFDNVSHQAAHRFPG